MEKNKLATQLYQVAARTFENMAFLIEMPEMNDTSSQVQFTAQATVSFHGPFCGKVTLQVDEELLQTLAANMLGEMDVPSESQQLDALGEMTNVITGNLLPAIAGSEKVFNLDAPVKDRYIEMSSISDSSMITTSLTLDSGSARIFYVAESEGGSN